MKKYLCILIVLFLVLIFFFPTYAEDAITKYLRPSINYVLKSKQQNKKTEVSDNLDAYQPSNSSFEEFELDELKILILQRTAPNKEFTAKKIYPPFTGHEDFDSDFEGINIGDSTLWLRSDLMGELPAEFRASSFEDSTYLLIADSIYMWDGTILVSDYKNTNDQDLPEFDSAEEMAQYFIEHPKQIESVTLYPKFGSVSYITFYETKSKKCLLYDYSYNPSKRFARNPEASEFWNNMEYIEELLVYLSDESKVDNVTANNQINELDFVPQKKKDLWLSCINAEEYSTAYHSIEEFYWSMADELKELDSSAENKENYNLIIKERNYSALSLFVSYCDYSGFDRSIDSIRTEKDYMATVDNKWVENTLEEILELLK